MNKTQEIELKLQIRDKGEIEEKLSMFGAVLKSKKKQIDILYNSKYFNFGDYDQSLRLRVEENGRKEATLTFKGTPKHTINGHKIRDEFTSPCDPGPMRRILKSIGFKEVAVIEKLRTEHKLEGVEVAIDELKFGIFIELEGPAKDIENLRKKLGLEKSKPVHQGYIFLQQAWEKKQK